MHNIAYSYERVLAKACFWPWRFWKVISIQNILVSNKRLLNFKQNLCSTLFCRKVISCRKWRLKFHSRNYYHTVQSGWSLEEVGYRCVVLKLERVKSRFTVKQMAINIKILHLLHLNDCFSLKDLLNVGKFQHHILMLHELPNRDLFWSVRMMKVSNFSFSYDDWQEKLTSIWQKVAFFIVILMICHLL